MRRPLFSLVVPVYREADGIAPFLKRVLPVLRSLPADYEVVFCLDPCDDGTEERIAAAVAKDKHLRLMVFSRRFGQPAATLAGLRASKGDAVAVIDVDLQDPPEIIPEMYARLNEGAEVVVAKRRSRRGETAAKRWVSTLGYWLINSVSDVAIPRETGDFRLMSRRVVAHVCALREKHGFLRGLVAFVGFKQAVVEFDRVEREQGEGKYNRYLGSLTIGFNGLVGFSNFLLNMTLLAGLVVSAFALVGALFMVVTFLMHVPYPVGIPSLTILVMFLGGLQLVSVGILGQYLGRVYDEVRDRPTSIVDRSYNLPGSARAPRR